MAIPSDGVKYFGVLFTTEGKMEVKINRRIGGALAVVQTLYWTWCGEEEAESESKTLD